MRARILIAEDNKLNYILLKEILQANKYETFAAGNGAELLEAVESLCPDLVLMDIQMPEVDGITATRLLKSNPRTKNIPVIAISSYAFEKEKNLFLSVGGDMYLTKPIDVDELLNMVESFLEEKADGGKG